MGLPNLDLQDCENSKFEEVGGKVHVRTTSTGGSTESKQNDIITQLQTINSLTPAVYDYIALSYTGDNLTEVVFKTGGISGTVVSTLTLVYTGSTLDSVTKT